jgi:thiol-disulfide isomerase/thioredoxin
MALKLCDEHVTLVAFTASWCGHCKAMKPELDQLMKRPQSDFHVFHFDTQDAANEDLFRAFNIQGFPTLLRYDPTHNAWVRYEGDRTNGAMYECTQSSSCTGVAWTTFPNIPQVPHAQVSAIGNNPSVAVSDLELCSDKPTLLAFTGLQWCPHCVVAQPEVEMLKKTARETQAFDVQQFDLVQVPESPEEMRAKQMIREFGIESYPTFLIYDHASKLFLPIRDIGGLRYALADFEALQSMRNNIKRENTWQQVPQYREKVCNNAMVGTMPNMEALVFIEQQPNEMTFVQQNCAPTPNLELKMCARCVTIIVFTGETWCKPCKDMIPEMKLLHAHQGCAKYHVQQFDFLLDTRNANTFMTEAFQIEEWPTFLMFDPTTRRFLRYRGSRQARTMMLCNTQQLVEWPTPANVTITLEQLTQQQDQVQVVQMEMRLQTNGKLKLCARCPTVLCFSLNVRTFAHLQEASVVAIGGSMHVLHFSDSQKHRTAFAMFGLETFPTILIYSPQLHLFFVYTGSYANLVTIYQQFVQIRVTPWKIWNTHPRIELVG